MDTGFLMSDVLIYDSCVDSVIGSGKPRAISSMNGKRPRTYGSGKVNAANT